MGLFKHEKPLNELQDRFCHEYVKYGRAGKAAQEAGYARASAHLSATRLLKDPRVLTRIEELKKTLLTVDNVTRKALLGEMVRACQDIKQPSAKVRAYSEIARVAGFSGADVQVSNDNRTVQFILPGKAPQTLNLSDPKTLKIEEDASDQD